MSGTIKDLTEEIRYLKAAEIDSNNKIEKLVAERDAALAQNAEYGRAGFVAGYSQAQLDPFTANDTEIELYADEYAAKQQEGEQ